MCTTQRDSSHDEESKAFEREKLRYVRSSTFLQIEILNDAWKSMCQIIRMPSAIDTRYTNRRRISRECLRRSPIHFDLVSGRVTSEIRVAKVDQRVRRLLRVAEQQFTSIALKNGAN